MPTAKADAPAAGRAHAITNPIGSDKKGREFPAFFIYRPLRKDINTPSEPTKPKPNINNPIGMPVEGVCSSNVSITSGAGSVNVGRRVGVTGAIKAASSVGLIVGVDAGVGVGGAGITGRLPVFTIFT